MSIPQSGGRLPFPSQTMHFIFMHCCLIAELSLIWELGRGISINVKSFGRHYFFFQPPIPQPGGECCSDFCAVGRQRRSPTLLIYCSQGCPLPPPPPPPPAAPRNADLFSQLEGFVPKHHLHILLSACFNLVLSRTYTADLCLSVRISWA